MEKWISVNDRVPEDGLDVIIYSESDGVKAGVWYSDEYGFEYPDQGFPIAVTHWMPLPEPPQDAE